MAFMLFVVEPRGQREERTEDEGREEALELAALCPAAEWATIEVRETGPCYLR